MNTADATGYLATGKPPTPGTDALPPYSGESTVCPKCCQVGAFTRYRKAGEHGENDLRTVRPSGKGERLERECTRCHFTWDEALATGPDPDAYLTAEDLAPLLHWAHRRWTLDLPPEHLQAVATELLQATVMLPRHDHPVWQAEPADSEGPR